MSDWLTNEIIFLHIPKTGGNWARKVFRESGIKVRKTNNISKHANYDLLAGNIKWYQSLFRYQYSPEWQQSHPKILKSHLTNPKKFFCVVRHPLLWYQSHFRYQHSRDWKQWGQNANTSYWHCLSPLTMPKTDDFNHFMKTVNKNTPGFLTYLYHSYTFPSNARVLKNEQLRDDLLLLNSDWEIGLDEKIIMESPKENKSKKSEIIWTEENIVRTLKNESAALEKYNYLESADSIVRIK